MMFPYDLPFLPGSSPPERWDVVVFRYPEEPEVSYIKRLVGLPGETIRITHGDIYVKPPGGTSYRLERKPLKHQIAMQMSVYDDRHRPKALADRDEWRRWQSADTGGWKVVDRKLSQYRAGGKGRRSVGRVALQASGSRPRTVGRHPRPIAPCPASPDPR